MEPGLYSSFITEGFLELSGVAATPAGPAQALLGSYPVPVPKVAGGGSAPPPLPPMLARIWRARPDLRAALAAYALPSPSGSAWDLTLLHTGYFKKNTDNIQMWQGIWSHPTWTYYGPGLGPVELLEEFLPVAEW